MVMGSLAAFVVAWKVGFQALGGWVGGFWRGGGGVGFRV